MWRWIKWTFSLLALLIVVLFFDYVLPQHDVVRITGTQVIRTDFTRFNRIFYAQADAGNASGTTRDVRLINAFDKNDRVIVFRNEDTGWIWPPYFKFNSSNLQAEAEDLQSTKEAPKWVVVTKYGWRIPFLSIYPNAVAVRAVAGPDVTVIPWFNIIFFVVLLVLIVMAWRMIAQFRQRTVDPFLEGVDHRADAVTDRARGGMGRFRGWMGTWQGKPRVPPKR